MGGWVAVLYVLRGYFAIPSQEKINPEMFQLFDAAPEGGNPCVDDNFRGSSHGFV